MNVHKIIIGNLVSFDICGFNCKMDSIVCLICYTWTYKLHFQELNCSRPTNNVIFWLELDKLLFFFWAFKTSTSPKLFQNVLSQWVSFGRRKNLIFFHRSFQTQSKILDRQSKQKDKIIDISDSQSDHNVSKTTFLLLFVHCLPCGYIHNFLLEKDDWLNDCYPIHMQEIFHFEKKNFQGRLA